MSNRPSIRARESGPQLTPDEIFGLLKTLQVTLRAIAGSLGIHESNVGHVIRGRRTSRRVEDAVVAAINAKRRARREPVYPRDRLFASRPEGV